MMDDGSSLPFCKAKFIYLMSSSYILDVIRPWCLCNKIHCQFGSTSDIEHRMRVKIYKWDRCSWKFIDCPGKYHGRLLQEFQTCTFHYIQSNVQISCWFFNVYYLRINSSTIRLYLHRPNLNEVDKVLKTSYKKKSIIKRIKSMIPKHT